jgi:uncharacterized SAM-binding protein YcdF (DUF218 family)
MASNKRRRLTFAIGLILVLIGLIALRRTLLATAGRVLVRDDHPTDQTEYLLLLMGDQTTMRARAACDALKHGLARTILIAAEKSREFESIGLEPSASVVHREFLIKQCGLAPLRVVILKGCETTSTLEEGLCFKSYFDQLEAKPASVVLVTGWYHTSRARWLIQSVLGEGIRVDAVPALAAWSNPDDWWESEESFLMVFEEYLKWTYWLTRLN